MDRPQEIYEWDLASAPTARTAINEAFAKVPLVTPEFVRYTSFDGRSIEGALLVPGGQRPAAPMRTVILIHGGPTGAWRDTYETWGQLLAAHGFAVFYPNIRGSTGYGHDFMVLNRGDWGGGDFKDVMAGVDWLVKEHVADPEKLGIAGWSYGGYMASWAITQTNRFKAAITGAGMSDLATEFGTEDGPAYDEWFYGLPYEKPDGFRKSSPLTYVTHAKTPTLILQGEDDVVDPLGQSTALYRALKRYGVECELVQYPREGHGLREEKHLTDRLTRIVAWFEKYLP
jgi:dipeptidyl aminopeptidase/acylaminoacyl peptidase